MTNRFVRLRRIAALSVAMTLFAAPIASAQSREDAPPIAAPRNAALLSPAAFGRLVQPPPSDVAPVPVVADPARPSLLRQATTTLTREAKAVPAKAPQQKSWASRHTGLLYVIGIVGGLFMWGLIAGQME